MNGSRRIAFALSLTAVGAVWLGVVGVAGLSSAGRSERLEARAEALDPPQLWSVEAVPQQAGWRPVNICTDSWMRTGFARPEPMVGDQPCLPIEDPVGGPQRIAFRCTVNGQTLGTSSTITGDPSRDFTARFTVTHLTGHLAGRPQSAYEQTRRYRKLGPCPEGWAVGDHSDRWGRRLKSALVTHSSPKT